MQEIFLVRQDDRKPPRMRSTAKQENKFNFKRNIYIPKMCVDLGPGRLQQNHDNHYTGMRLDCCRCHGQL